MVLFCLNKYKKSPTFEEWLEINGYFYIRTRKNKPCFKPNLTQKLKKKYKTEMKNTKMKK